jgi:hypothetical protein
MIRPAKLAPREDGKGRDLAMLWEALKDCGCDKWERTGYG